jgi:hypothetical protein
MVLPEPDIVTVPVPCVKVEEAPDVFQFPLTVQDPEVSVRIPDDPPVMVTSETETVETLAVRIPPFPMLRAPPVRPRLPVASVVVDEASLMARVPPHFRAFVAMVKVTGLAEEDWKVTFPPNSCVRLPNAIVTLEADVKVMAAAKDHEPEVDELVHDPDTVHVPAPDVM